ncbi:MAG: O-methyltransferase [Flavobacteriaceae bacterium]|jgi:predicted O-methyltransferase YrrM|nr:O-methyltransferase [Flavobacteriaceae bacterium]CAI8379131.1 MAG: Putative O-methyltransferase [Flavobacteriaceae bacterium]|tara:strand:+ start:1401 stop:2045 length:645 start_codon:yes stop_codon:yes gene_type:complete
MNYINEHLEDYIIKHSQQEPRILKDLNRETNLKVLQPRMISGAHQGRLLSIISKIISPTKILEIGTFTGYSTLCLSEGLTKGGRIHTVDINEELYDFQRKYFKKSPFNDNIIQHLGNALEVIPTMDNNFDLIFLDADKNNYPEYLDVLISKLKIGGVLLSDNVLWDGKVLNPISEKDISTKAIVKYNKLLSQREDMDTVILPIRDGLTISRKIK